MKNLKFKLVPNPFSTALIVTLLFLLVLCSCGPMPPGPPPRLLGPGLGPEGVWFILLLAIAGIAFWVTQHKDHSRSDRENFDKDSPDYLLKRLNSLESRLERIERLLSELKKD